MGANDVRYATFAIACMKTGHSVLLPSPRNLETMFLHVLNTTGSSKFIYSPERQEPVEGLQQADKSLQSWEIPGLWEIFDKKVDHFPCNTRYADVEDEASIIIHSSGTTGFPKPVYLTNGFFSVMDNASKMPLPSGRRGTIMSMVKPGVLFFTMAPFFYLMGYATFVESICHSTPFVLSPEKPMTLELLTHICDETGPVNAIITPSVIEDIGTFQAGLNLLKRFEAIVFGGAPLSPEIGDQLCQDIHLQTVIGTSEAGVIVNIMHIMHHIAIM